MPRSGGTFTRTDGTRTGSTVWQQARDSGVKIVATGMDTHDQDVADALTASIAKDGQTTPTANLPMGTKRHTGVGDGAARTDYASAGQSQDGSLNWVDGGGTADAITATYAPVITTLIDGQLCHVRATAANATTTPTFAPNGLTAHNIVKEGGSALVAGDIVGDSHELVLRYNLANTRWELLNPGSLSAGMPTATYDPAAIAEQLVGLTTAQTLTNKTLTAPIISTISNTGTVTLPTDTDTLVGKATTDTLTNKTIDADATGNVMTNIGSSEVKSELITGQTNGTVAVGDSFLFSDVDDSGNLKDDTIQGILDLVPSSGPNLGTPVATTSGTSIDFTSIPSGTKRIKLMFDGVSTTGISNIMVQLGDSGGIEASGYSGTVLTYNAVSPFGTAMSTGFVITSGLSAASIQHGTIELVLVDASTFTWAMTGILGRSDVVYINWAGGSKSLSAELDRVRFTTVGGLDTFDAGKINIQYEG